MIQAKKLMCENRTDYVGVGCRQPAFSWILEECRFQTAYRVVVSEDDGFQNVIWDSQKTASPNSICVIYAGEPLQSLCKYFWKVKVWDENGQESEWTEPAFFVTSILDPAKEWKGTWISGESEADFYRSEGYYLQKKFRIPEKKIESAYLLSTAHGMYEMQVNGAVPRESLFAPGWTEYKKRLQFETTDVAEFLKPGENVVRAHIGPGWYKGDLAGWIHLRGVYGKTTGFNGALLIRYEDGTQQWVVSDKSWEVRESPVLYSEIYHGEIQDTRKNADGEQEPALLLKNARECPDEIGNLVPMDGADVKRMEFLAPQKLMYTPNGELLLDFGQNMVGYVRIRISGYKDDYVELSHGEVLDKDGNLYTGNLREARQRVKYILNGEADQILEPHFSWQGFRYVRIDHYPCKPRIEDFEGVVVYSEMEKAGTFHSSDEMLNRLEQNIRWGMKGNFVDIPTDCPQRDERMGWTGDIQVFSRTAGYLMKITPFFRKWLRDLAAAQIEDGGIPYVVPDILTYQDRDVRNEGANHSAAGWGDAAVICPWRAYQASGDLRFLEEFFPMMQGWVEYIHSQAENGVIWNSGYQYGDWLALDAEPGSRFGKTPNDLTATAYYANSVQIVGMAAGLLGKREEEARYRSLYEDIRAAFQKEFYREDGHLKARTQTACVLSLAFHLAGENAENTLEDLEALIREWKGLSTGFLGTPYICHVLSEYGRDDLAYRLLMKKEYPSWLYPVTKGATTIWEHWDSIKTDGSFWSDSMNSFNHYAYGCIGDWMYSKILGIDQYGDGAGFGKIKIAPVPGGGLTWAAGSLDTPYGMIRVIWKATDQVFELDVEIPCNTTAQIVLPDGSVREVFAGKYTFSCWHSEK